MKYKLTFIFLLVLKAGFAEAQTDSAKNNIFFTGDKLDYDTLFIEARFMECGEFGGHNEKSTIFKTGCDFFISYQKYSFECKDQLGKWSLIRTLTTDTLKKLSIVDQSAIRQYINNLMTAKMRESCSGNAASTFRIYTADFSLQIYVRERSMLNEKEYLTFINSLFK